MSTARDALLAEILGSPDRDSCPGSLPVLSLHDDDEPAFRASVRERATLAVELHRRGVDHGRLVEVQALDLLPDFRRVEPGPGPWAGRFHEAQPIVLRRLLDTEALPEDDLRESRLLFDRLAEPGGLRAWVEERLPRLDPRYEPGARRVEEGDLERDIERVCLDFRPGGSGKVVPDLWLKSGWLSTHPDDRSLRLRCSFGREGSDDASVDSRRHALVPALADAFLPLASHVTATTLLREHVETASGEAVAFSQHIGYWNAPEGGALFHHDAFGDPDPSDQIGVAYVQCSGATAWLALPIADLVDRVIEFGEWLQEGEMPWVRSTLFGSGETARFSAFVRKLEDRDALTSELALPGQGSLGPLVNRGPEFTALLADCGHAFLLRAGDAIVLPNHGYSRTAMHSVFAITDETGEPGYALSIALRRRRS